MEIIGIWSNKCRTFIDNKHLLFWAIIICTFSEGLRQLLFGMPIVHFGNIICLFLFVKVLIQQKASRLLKKDILPYIIWASVFCGFGCIGAVVFRLGIVELLWGIRTYLRMFLLLFDCILILENSDLLFLYKMFNVAIAIHFVLILIQFFAFGIRWDYLNGIFGTRVGDSSSLHALLIINSCLILYAFYIRRISWKLFLVHFTWMSCNAALSEIRGWYYEIIALMIAYLVITFDLKRILKLSPALIIIFIVGLILMGIVYPYTSKSLSVSGFSEIMTESHRPDIASAIGRKNQIFAMTKPMLEYAKDKVGKDTGILPLAIGLGLGSADYATIPFLKSEFFLINEKLGYASFLLSFLYVETGIIGLVIFNMLWPYLIYKGMKLWKDKQKESLLLILGTLALAVTAFYNQTLRTNYGYIMWIFLGVIVVYNRSDIDDISEKRMQEDGSNKHFCA